MDVRPGLDMAVRQGQYLLRLSELEANLLAFLRRRRASYSGAVIRLGKEQL
jgi:hypothetical protein